MSSSTVWRNRDYLVLWGGQTVSVLGSGVSQIALPLLVLSLTGSPAQAGLVVALADLPYPLFGLLAGALVDRWNRRRVMAVCEATNVLTTCSVPIALWLGYLTVGQLAAVALASGTAFVLFNVAEVAAIPSVVAREQIAAATAQNQATFGIAGLVGRPLGGVLYGVSRPLPFLVDSVSYAVSLVSLLLIKTPFQPERSAGAGVRKVSAEVREGLAWVWRHPDVRALTLCTALYNLLTGGYTLLIIVLARERGASAALVGLVFGLGYAGALLGSMLAPAAGRRLTVGQLVITFYWVAALSYPLYLLAPNALTLGAVAALTLLLSAVSNVAVLAYRLRTIPDQLQGRVNSVVRTAVLGVNPLGAAITGLLLERAGSRWTVWTLFAGMALLALAATSTPSLRGAGSGEL